MTERVTSTGGQVLDATIDGDTVVLSSKAGNHGTVTLAQWRAKVEQMRAAGYTVEVLNA